MAASTVVVKLVGDATSLTKAFRDSEGKAAGWGQKMTGAGKAMTLGLTLPIVAGAGLAVNAAAEEEQQMAVLANAIRKNIPDATDEAIAANEDWITSMQNVSGIADGELRDAIQQLVQAGVPLADAQEQVADAMDISVAKGVDLATVTKGLVKANQGNTAALKKMGLVTEDASGQALTLDQILANAADTMGGAAATAADTAAGRTAIMQAKLADLTETIGTMLIPILDKLVGFLSTIFDWFNNLSPGAQKMIAMLLGVVAAVGPLLIVGAKLVQAFGVIKNAMIGLNLVMAINPFVLIIAAVIALVVIIVMNWDKIVAFLKTTWEWIKRTSAAVWEGIKAALKAALDFIVRLFLNWTLPGLLIKHWDKIKAGVTAVKDFIVGVWNGIVGFFKGLPAKISNAVAGMWDGLKTAFRSAVNWILEKWNALRITIGGGTVLGVKVPKIVLDTPNVPLFHSGGTFHAPTPGGEGLAVLRDRERVLRPGQSAGGGSVQIIVNAGMGTDPNAVGKAVLEALQRYQRTNGPLPLDVRLN